MWASLGLLICAVGIWHRTLGSRAMAGLAALGVLGGLLLLVAYGAIDRLTGSGIDASVVYHLQTGLEGAATADFTGLAVGTVAAVLGAMAAAGLAYRLVRTDEEARHGLARGLAGAALLGGAFWVNPAVGDLVRLVGHAGIQAKAPAGPAPPGFVAVDRLAFAGPRRNLVVLYLESVERSYLDDTRFPGLMPNLRALEAEAVSFTDITEVEEAGWTIAGMVASQCGIPLVGSGAGMDRFLPGATCLGDLLDAEGYALAYMGGADLGFAGKGTFYGSHGFDLVEGRTELAPRLADPDYVNDWGLFDDSLYPEVRKRFDALAAGDAPFVLAMLTLDTHHPFGFRSQSCADQPYGDGSNPMLNAVHCADRLAADFIRDVRSSPAFADTVLVVASDHMAMPNLAQEQLDAGERRNLLMLFAPGLEPALIDKPGTTLDIGPTILGVIGAPTPALGYGRDLLAGEATLRAGEPGLSALIDQGRGFLWSMWAYPQLSRGLAIDSEAGEVLLGDQRLKYPALFVLDDRLAVTQVKFELHSDIPLVEMVAGLPDDQRFLWIDACQRTAVLATGAPADGASVCLLAGQLGNVILNHVALSDGVPLTGADVADLFASTDDRLALRDSLFADVDLRRQFTTEEIIAYTPPNGLTGRILVRSAGYGQGASWVWNPQAGERVRLLRGLTLLGLTAEGAPVRIGHVDTCGYGGRYSDMVPLQGGFAEAMARDAKAFGGFVIVSHDSVICYGIDPGLEPLFAGTGLMRWRDLDYEQPYVAVIAGNGEVQEFVGSRRTALGIEVTDALRSLQETGQRQLAALPRIAHAGGGLDGKVYTNSLEALSANAAAYELFEIDFSWTSDGELICLRYWNVPFLAKDGVLPTGPLPLAEAQARAARQAGFTPCTLATLADWMQAHAWARVVPDLKSGAVEAYARIAETYPGLKDRFIPQIYQPRDYARVRDMGYDEVIWAIYQYVGDDAAVLAQLPDMDLLGLSIPVDRVWDGLARKAQAATGVLTWVHTVDDPAQLEAVLAAGAAEVFTNALTPSPLLRFDVLSSGYDAGESAVVAPDGTTVSLTRGVSLLDLTPGAGPALLATFDGCAGLDTGTAPDPGPFRQSLTNALSQRHWLALVVHDSAFCEGVDLATVLAGTPLRVAPGIDFRSPYIGLIRPDGRVTEATGAPGTRLRRSLMVEVGP